MKLKPSKNRAVKLVYLACGFLFAFIGLIGVLFPLIPGFLFFIPAVFCFAKASSGFNRWISRSKIFGKYFNKQ